MAKEKFKWVRVCGGECCEKCAPYSGKVYDEDQEAEAKKKLHPNCGCTAYKVPKCKDDMIFEGGLSVSNVDGSYSFWSKKFSFSATVTNSASVNLEDIEVDVEVSVDGEEVLNETYSRGSLNPGDSFEVSGSGTIDRTTAATASGNISVVADATYTKAGEEKKATNACWY